MAKHQEHWAGFPGEFEEAPALITMDLGWADEAPDQRRGMLVRVRVPVPPPDEERGHQPFLEMIEPFDEALHAELPKKLNAVSVAFLLTEQHRWWVFYASRADGAPELVARLAARTKGLEAEVIVEDDPEWEFYGEVLFPDEGQQRYIADQSVVEQLMEAGDESDVARPIEHLAVFPDAKARDAFVKWCASNGFSVTEVGAEFDDDMDGFVVEFTHVGPAITDDICEKTCLASEGAEQFGGEYDGWQTAVVRDGKPVME